MNQKELDNEPSHHYSVIVYNQLLLLYKRLKAPTHTSGRHQIPPKTDKGRDGVAFKAFKASDPASNVIFVALAAQVIITLGAPPICASLSAHIAFITAID